MTGRPLIIGVGQPWRGDDAAGLAALALLAPDDGDLCAHHGEGLGLMALWEGRERVILLDAAQAAGSPGRLHRIDTAAPLHPDGPLFRCSSHSFGVHEAVETARILDRLPRRMIVHAVEGGIWELGALLSPEVDAALPRLVEAVRRDLAAG